MPTSDDKSKLLRSFLSGLPAHIAVRLAKAVEADRQMEGKALPHEQILEGLRPALRQAESGQRTPTPLRLFCRPFEDLLYTGPHRDRQKGRIMRANVVPAWNWLCQRVIPSDCKSFTADIRALALTGKNAEALERAAQFWPVAGEALRNAIDGRSEEARAALGGEVALEDAREMSLLLSAGASMIDIQNLMPRQTPAMTEALVWELRNIYDRVVSTVPDAAPFVAVVAMRRLAKPWEALKLAQNVSRQTNDTLIASTDMGLVGDILFADLEDFRAALMATRHPNFDLDALVCNLSGFISISTAIVKEMEILRKGKWGQRLLGDRAAVGQVMDGFMERAPKEIAGAMPLLKAGFSGASRVPDFTRPAEPERAERALRYARLLAQTKVLAAPGSFGTKHQDAVDEATLFLRGYNEDVIRELRAAEGARRDIVERQYHLALELTQNVLGDEEAELLRRRGKAAMPPQAA